MVPDGGLTVRQCAVRRTLDLAHRPAKLGVGRQMGRKWPEHARPTKANIGFALIEPIHNLMGLSSKTLI